MASDPHRTRGLRPLRVVGLRARLFLVSLILVGAFAVTSGVWFASQVRNSLTGVVEETLESHAAFLVTLVPRDAGATELIGVVDELSHAAGARVTLIDADGRVLADSDAVAAEMDNHGTRPELLDALGPAGRGMSKRHSDTVKQEMLYVAVQWPRPQGTGIVRIARSLEQVDEQVARFRGPLWVAGFGGLVLTVILAGLFSTIVTRDLRALTVRARQLARPTEDPGADEIAWITGSIDRLAQELQRALDDLAGERNRLQAVLGGMREAVIALDAEGKVETINPAARALLEVSESTEGRSFEELAPGEDLQELVARVLQSGIPGSAELGWSGRAEPSRELALLATATAQVGGGAVVVLHDVTELRRLEAVRRDFVANVSHELRTPVAVIQSSSEALVDGAYADPVHAKRFAEAIGRHAQRLGTLIVDLLDLARVESGHREMDLRAVALAPMVRAVVEGLSSRSRARSQAVTVRVAGELRVAADPVALEQVLVNLLDNAIKYGNHGGRIEISASQVDGAVRIDVSDDGPGIEVAQRDRVFERFYRVDPGRSRAAGGTGLGLSIVRHLVEAQGGSVRVLGNHPRGARFRVELRSAP